MNSGGFGVSYLTPPSTIDQTAHKRILDGLFACSWGNHVPQLGLFRKLGYEFMSQSALAALTVIADMTCPMDVEFHLCVLTAHI